jgi:hypothetical protein
MIAAALLLTIRPEVFIFVLENCPIARKFAPEIKRIAGEYQPKGVQFTLVHVDPQTTAAGAKTFAADFGYALPFRLDPEHKLARRAEIANVPAVAVYTGGRLRYTGRIDDRFPKLGVQRSAPTRRDLRIALDQILAGTPVTMPKTKAVGCTLPTL